MDHNDFDRYAAGKGWYYDNGWSFKGDHFGASYTGFEFINTEQAGYYKNYLRLLRHDDSGDAAVIHIVESE